MYFEDKLTKKARKAIEYAAMAAAEAGHGYVGSEHLLAGLTKEEEGLAGKILRNNGITYEKVIAEAEKIIGKGDFSQPPKEYTPRTKRILEISLAISMQQKSSYVGTEHLLYAIVEEGENIANRIIESLGGDVSKISSDIISAIGYHSGEASEERGGGASSGTPVLDKYGRDLTKMAQEGKLDPVIGRSAEIDRVIQILSRRTKNNPVLIGEPGVGKTAIAEGLAQLIAADKIPENLSGKRVVTLDLSGMLAGAKYRGEFEERLKDALKEVSESKSIILFIDEIHTLIGAGAAEGAIDAANILKPMLARGEIQLVGATTIDEYRKHIEKDAALERRFQPVMVEPPSKEESVEILKGLRDKYEAHHNIKITDEAIEAAVKLSDRYIMDRFLPDKAIDLIDEACSKARISSLIAPPNLKEMEERAASLLKDKEEAIKAEDFEKAAKIRDEELALAQEIAHTRKEWSDNKVKNSGEIGEYDIAQIVSGWTRIPVGELTAAESKKLINLEEVLHKRLVGQNEAVCAVSRAIRRGRAGLKDPKRPTGSFIFLGPTGVGKTELSKALAEAVFSDEDALIRVDMSEYMEKHTVSRLIGSPPGYVGYDEGGQLTEKVRRKPYSVILFDEIEKAHPDVFNILLQILEDGILTDGQGRKVDFKNTIIIMTSNLGARKITEKTSSLGFGLGEQKESEDIKSAVMGELKQAFRPEFLNRLDDIIVFTKLSEGDIKEICRRMLNQVKKRLLDIKIDFEYDDEVCEHLATVGFDKVYGARPLRREIQRQIEDALSELIIEGKVKEDSKVRAVLENGKVEFKI